MLKIEFKLNNNLTVIKAEGRHATYYDAYEREPFKPILRTTDRAKIDAVIARYR